MNNATKSLNYFKGKATSIKPELFKTFISLGKLFKLLLETSSKFNCSIFFLIFRNNSIIFTLNMSQFYKIPISEFIVFIENLLNLSTSEFIAQNHNNLLFLVQRNVLCVRFYLVLVLFEITMLVHLYSYENS